MSKFQQYYLQYLTQHQNKNCRTMHFIGASLVLATLVSAALYLRPEFLVLVPFFGYGFSRSGHFLFERRKRATVNRPLYHCSSYFVMFWHILTGKLDHFLEEAKKFSFSSGSDSKNS